MFGVYPITEKFDEIAEDISNIFSEPWSRSCDFINLENRYLDDHARDYLKFAHLPSFIERNLREYEKISVLQTLMKLGHKQAVCDYLSQNFLTYKNDINLDAYCHFYENFNLSDYISIARAAQVADISKRSLKETLSKVGFIHDGVYHDFIVMPELYATFGVFFMPEKSGVFEKPKPSVFIRRDLLTRVIYDYHAVDRHFAL